MATAELMSATTAEQEVERPPLFAAADIEYFPRELPSGLFDYELIDGELVMMNRPSVRHGSLQARLTGELLLQGERQGFGKVYTELGLLLSRNPDTVLGPDICFITKGIFPLVESAEGYLETRPSLAIEVRSKNDSRPYIARKAQSYLDAGVPVVWLVDGVSKTVTILRPNQPPEILAEAQTLTAEEIIPGFKLSLADLFRE